MIGSTEMLIESLAKKLGLHVIYGDVMTCTVKNAGQVTITDGGYPYVLMNLRNMVKAIETKKTFTKLNARCNAVNNVHSFLDVISVEMKEYLADGYKISVAGPNFLKKDHEAIAKMVEQHNPDQSLVVELIVKSYSIQVSAKAMYFEDGTRSGNALYYRNWVNVWDRSTDKPEERDQCIDLWHVADLVRMHAEYPAIEKQLTELTKLKNEYDFKLNGDRS